MSAIFDFCGAMLLALGVALGACVGLVLLVLCITMLVSSFFPEDDDHE